MEKNNLELEANKIIDQYIVGIDPYQPFLDMFTHDVNVFMWKETGRKLKRHPFFLVNWYRKLFNKQKWNVDYICTYHSPYGQ